MWGGKRAKKGESEYFPEDEFQGRPAATGKEDGWWHHTRRFPTQEKMDFPLLKTNMEVRVGGPHSGIARDTPDPAERIKNSNRLSFFRKEAKL